MYIREDQADIRLKVWDVNGNAIDVGDGNSFYDYTGAGLTAKGAKTRAGGMGAEIELGGPATRGNVTLNIQNSDVMVAQHGWLESRVGKAKCLVLVTYLDDEEFVIPGAQFRVTGKLLGAELPGQKTDSATVGMYKIEVGANEKAS